MPSKFGELIPHVTYDDRLQEDIWLVGGRPAALAWFMTMAGYDGLWPERPRRIQEIDPASYKAALRQAKLREFGVRMQILYPNLLGFFWAPFLAVKDNDFRLACVRAYNDFLVDFSNEAPGTFIPVMALPFWDVEASVLEMRRAADLGHKGILFANRPELAGSPPLRDKAWDPLFAAAQEAGLSINFHIGFGVNGTERPAPKTDLEELKALQGTFDISTADYAKQTALGFVSNGQAIAEVIVSGLAHRFPTLNFVSVESGFGYVPYLLEALDWQWLNGGAARENPERLMPSEYFRRQMYGTFWFEKISLEKLVDLYPDNMMFETDFPHPTSLSPGPASFTGSPSDVVERNLAGLPDHLQRKLLHENAARVYHLPPVEPVKVAG
jgi:predicted TIM-barrel fold metal-dependent hydrolase